MSGATDADRAKEITRLLDWMLTEIRAAGVGSKDDVIAHVATIVMDSIVEEREKARAPFLTLADDLEGRYLPFSSAQGQAYDIANEIRRAAEESSE